MTISPATIGRIIIFMIDSKGRYEIIAGKQGVSGNLDGSLEEATFDRPNGIVASKDGKTLYVAQQGEEGAIRVITGFNNN